MKRLLLFLILTASQPFISQPGVNNVDLKQYAGKWFVIASIPTKFDKNWNFVTETYILKDNGNIAIETSYIKKRKTKQHTAYSKGFPVSGTNNIEWKIQFVWPFRADYLVEELAEDYSYVVVGHPKKKFLYIMSRTNTLDEELYKGIATRCKTRGYNVAKINKVPQ